MWFADVLTGMQRTIARDLLCQPSRQLQTHQKPRASPYPGSVPASQHRIDQDRLPSKPPMSSEDPPRCYRPDGSEVDGRYAPCRLGGTSMCCRTNDTQASFPDICRSDGLCQETQNTEIVWRESCTDPTWQAPECLQLCVGGCPSTQAALVYVPGSSALQLNHLWPALTRVL